MTLFYGPWMLCHRFEEIEAALDADKNEFVRDFSKEPLYGLGVFGESFRIRLAANARLRPEDVLATVGETDGELWLYRAECIRKTLKA